MEEKWNTKEVVVRCKEVTEFTYTYEKELGELIRCLNCEHYDVPYNFCWRWLIEIDPWGFCSEAELRTSSIPIYCDELTPLMNVMEAKDVKRRINEIYKEKLGREKDERSKD